MPARRVARDRARGSAPCWPPCGSIPSAAVFMGWDSARGDPSDEGLRLIISTSRSARACGSLEHDLDTISQTRRCAARHPGPKGFAGSNANEPQATRCRSSVADQPRAPSDLVRTMATQADPARIGRPASRTSPRCHIRLPGGLPPALAGILKPTRPSSGNRSQHTGTSRPSQEPLGAAGQLRHLVTVPPLGVLSLSPEATAQRKSADGESLGWGPRGEHEAARSAYHRLDCSACQAATYGSARRPGCGCGQHRA